MVCPLNIVFDIDETLVYFIHSRYVKNTWDTLTSKEQDKYKSQGASITSHVTLLRPGLLPFLKELKSMGCQLYLWTWSDIEYAEGIADLITKRYKQHYKIDNNNNLFKFILVDKDAEASSEKYGFAKDLNWLWHDKPHYEAPELPVAWKETKTGIECFSECNTILIDDLPTNSVNPSNRLNSITVAPFAPFGGNKARDGAHNPQNDNVLKEVLEIIHLAHKEAVQLCFRSSDREAAIFDSGDYDQYMRSIRYGKVEGKDEIKYVQGVCAGESHLFKPRPRTKGVDGKMYTKTNKKAGRNLIYIGPHGSEYLKKSGMFVKYTPTLQIPKSPGRSRKISRMLSAANNA